jgi:hypothetical protein
MTQRSQVVTPRISRQIGFWTTLAAIVPLLALAGPVNVKPVHVDPGQAEAPDMREFRDEYPKLPHTHGEVVKPADQDLSRFEQEQRQNWNQLCDRVINSSGALRQIVLFDRPVSRNRAAFDFQHCKQDSPYATGSRGSFEIRLLDVLLKKGDEPALDSIYHLLASGGDAGSTYPLLHYLAVRSSKNCFPDSLLTPLQEQMKSGAQAASAALEYHVLLRLLNQVSLERLRRPARTDGCALQQVTTTVAESAKISGGDVGAVRRASILLKGCFDKCPK